MANCPHARLEASEGFVGLPSGQMGNSEVGHMTLGSGRIVQQDLPRIDTAVAGKRHCGPAGMPEIYINDEINGRNGPF